MTSAPPVPVAVAVCSGTTIVAGVPSQDGVAAPAVGAATSTAPTTTAAPRPGRNIFTTANPKASGRQGETLPSGEASGGRETLHLTREPRAEQTAEGEGRGQEHAGAEAVATGGAGADDLAHGVEAGDDRAGLRADGARRVDVEALEGDQRDRVVADRVEGRGGDRSREVTTAELGI